MVENSNTNEHFESSGSPSGPCPNCKQWHSPGTDCRQSDRPPQDALVGKTIGGKYQILSLLGCGGMSKVYKARQMPINRIVALKMLLAQLSHQEESVMRFLQEARAAGQVLHANVVSVFDFGLAEDYQPYLVMDYLEGDSLAEVLKREGRLPYQEAIPIFLQICDGMAAAHECGVIHRDIKPSNIVLQNLAAGKRVRLVDFGIAKMIDVESQHLTKTGEVFGSPFYMSPEQCEGLTLDRRTDIYSLGVVFYETLSGKVPLAGRSAIETMSLHMQSMAPSLQKAAGPQADIPAALENIVFKMMERSREKRYAGVLEVKRDLELAAAGQSEVLSGNISMVRRELSRKSKVLTAVLVSVAIMGLAGELAYPHACSALAQQQFDRGAQALKISKFSDAEPCLKSAADLSRQAGNTALESRVLGSLVKVYRHQNKRDLLKQARNRRRELIKAEFSRFDLNEETISRLMAAGSKEDNLVAALPQAPPANMPEPKQEAADDFGAAPAPIPLAQPHAAPPLSPASVPMAGSLDKAPQNEGDGAGSGSGFAPTLQGATNATIGPAAGGALRIECKPKAALSPGFMPPHRDSIRGGGPAAAPGQQYAPEGSAKYDRRAKETEQRSDASGAVLIADSRTRQGFGGGGGGAGASYSAPGNVSIPTLAPTPVACSGGGGRGGGGGLSALSGSVSAAGRARGIAAAGELSSSNAGGGQTAVYGRLKNKLTAPAVPAADQDDQFDRLQAILEVCLEKNLFKETRSCAEKAIALAEATNFLSEAELAEIYSARAWSRLNLKTGDRGLADAGQSWRLAQSGGADSQKAESLAVQAAINVQLGGKELARKQYEMVRSMIGSGVPSRPLTDMALKKYAAQAGK
jgi:serine/threonine protein kinase